MSEAIIKGAVEMVATTKEGRTFLGVLLAGTFFVAGGIVLATALGDE